MGNLQVHDFLTEAADSTIRQAALNVLSSYSHDYDILAESLQNAVDAIDERYAHDPSNTVARILIRFDVPARTIQVTDTGTGMSWERLKTAPTPNITYKKTDRSSARRRSRGEKGVGLSFLTFSCNRLTITTSDGSSEITGVISSAFDWLHRRVEDRPRVEPEAPEPLPAKELLGSTTYTQVTLEDVHTEDSTGKDIFSLSESQLIYLLRTRTAIGHTDPIIQEEDPEPEIQVEVEFINGQGQTSRHPVPFRFLSPEEELDEGSLLKYGDFLALIKHDRLHQAKGKALTYRATHKTSGNRKIFAYAFAMAPRAYQDLTRDRELQGEYAPEDWSGIYVATRGMPTGIKVEPPKTGLAGYWRRVFVLLQDDSMKFDLGRKTLQGRAVPMMQEIARKVWDDIAPYLQKLTPTDTESVRRRKKGKLAHLLQEATTWPDLGLSQIQMKKEPQREQMVVGLFYELVGADILHGYRTLRNNTFDQYDAFVEYVVDKERIGKIEAADVRGKLIEDLIIVEFKHSAASMLDDIKSDTKHYGDVDLLVCWKLDIEQLNAEQIAVDELSPDQVYYYGSTHRLHFPGYFQMAESLSVIELKTVVERLRQKDGDSRSTEEGK